MKLEGEYIFNGTREEVWDLVRDPEVLATALPGTQDLQKISDIEYAGKMNIRVGPVSGVFSGKVLVSNEVPPESYTLSVEGRGAAGHGQGAGDVQLIDQGDGTTLMKYSGELQVGGKMASVGQRLLDSVSRSITRQGLETLNKALQAKGQAKTEGREVEYTPPSEAQFAASVVKDMASEVFSPEHQAVWTAVAIAIVSLMIGFWLGKSSQRG
ncbi:MAG TPA: carbon monoxide dehydrogenase subunit G [Chloroflexi bacterium]|nr:carbon monoxide dehydrogenase subunit G [Chloroflexota bacterium]